MHCIKNFPLENCSGLPVVLLVYYSTVVACLGSIAMCVDIYKTDWGNQVGLNWREHHNASQIGSDCIVVHSFTQ